MNRKMKDPAFLPNSSFERIARRDGARLCFNRVYPDKVNFGVWIWYGSARRLFLSGSFSVLLGMSEGAVTNLESLAEHIYPGDVERFLRLMEGLLDGICPDDFTFRVGYQSPRTIQCVVEAMEEGDVVGVCWAKEQ